MKEVVLKVITNNIIIEQDKGRKQWVDSLRALAMIMVVYGHCVRGWTEYFVFTSPVKMPLFFIISGYLFKPRKGNTKAFFKNLFFKLVIPWIVLGLIYPTLPTTRILSLLSGKALWFMPCLIIGEIVWFFLRKYTEKTWLLILYGILISIIGYTLAQYHILDYAMFNTALTVQLFFVTGFLIAYYEDAIQKQWLWIILLGVISYLSLTVMSLYIFPGQIIDVHLNYYFNLPYCILVILIGCIFLFVSFKKYNIGGCLFAYIGQNTLIIYIFHSIGINIFSKVIPETSICGMIPFSLYALFRTVFSIVICCIIAEFLKRYVPEIIGKKRSSKI